jgi:hypothetical protein
MTLLHTSPIPNVSIKEYRTYLNLIREKIESQSKLNPFRSTEEIHNHDTIAEFCIKVLLGLKEKRKKSRCKET